MTTKTVHVYDDFTDGEGRAVLPDTARCGLALVDKDKRRTTFDVCAAGNYKASRAAISRGKVKKLKGAKWCAKCVRGLAALLLAISLSGCMGIPVRDVAAGAGTVAGALTPEPVAAIVAPIADAIAKPLEAAAARRESEGNDGPWTTILGAAGAALAAFAAARGRRTTSHVDELYDETKQLGAKVAALEGRPRE